MPVTLPVPTSDGPLGAGVTAEDPVVAWAGRILNRSDGSEDAAISALLAHARTLLGTECALLTTLSHEDGVRIQTAAFVDYEDQAPFSVEPGSCWPWDHGTCSVLHDQGKTHTPDFGLEFPDHPLGRELQLRTFVSIPVCAGSTDEIIATLCLLDHRSDALNEESWAMLELTLLAMSTILVRRWQAERDRTRLDAAHDRLRRHLARVVGIQDVMGNGIAVAIGLLDTLGTGSLQLATRHEALRAAQRRLLKVQDAINELLDVTSQEFAQQLGMEDIDLADLWLEITGSALDVPAEGAARVTSHGPSLRLFLQHANEILGTTLEVSDGRAHLEVTDLSRLDTIGRAHLRASIGRFDCIGTLTQVSWEITGSTAA